MRNSIPWKEWSIQTQTNLCPNSATYSHVALSIFLNLSELQFIMFKMGSNIYFIGSLESWTKIEGQYLKPRRHSIHSAYDYFKVWLNQAARNSMIEVPQFLGHAKTFLKRGSNNLKLSYSCLFNSLGSVQKQKRKRNSRSGWHGLIPLCFQEIDMVLFLYRNNALFKNLLKEYILIWPLSQHLQYLIPVCLLTNV